MQAWEIAAELFENAVPKLLEEEEQTWEENFSVNFEERRARLPKCGKDL